MWCYCCEMCFQYIPVFFFKQKTAYGLRISDWSSDVCSSDLDQILLYRGDGRIDQLGAVIGLACNNVRRQRLVDFDQLVGDAIGNDAAVLASEHQEDRKSVV